MRQNRVADPRSQLINLHTVNSFLRSICLPVRFSLLQSLLMHLSGKACAQHLLGVFAARNMKLHVCMIPVTVILLKLCRLLRIINRLSEVVGDIFLQALIRLRRVIGKCNA